MAETVLIDVADGVATLTLNRPTKLNALNYETIDRLMKLFDWLETADAARVVILTGSGRAFSAGADIYEFSQSLKIGVDTAVRDFVRRGQAMTARIEAFRKPVIVAVNGICFGGGCEITEAAHLAVASESAVFSKPEISLGMLPTFGGTQRLPRLAGRKRAFEWLLTGDRFSTSQALALGLINAVVPHDELLPAAYALAKRILLHSSPATASILAAVTRGLNVSILEGLQIESEQFARIAPTQNLKEGLAAWVEKRSLNYSG